MNEVASFEEPILHIADHLGLWATVYKRWLLTMHSAPWKTWRYLEMFRLNRELHATKEVRRISEQFRLNEVVGVHLRGDEWQYNCMTVLKWDPRRLFYNCYQETYSGVLRCFGFMMCAPSRFLFSLVSSVSFSCAFAVLK